MIDSIFYVGLNEVEFIFRSRIHELLNVIFNFYSMKIESSLDIPNSKKVLSSV